MWRPTDLLPTAYLTYFVTGIAHIKCVRVSVCVCVRACVYMYIYPVIDIQWGDLTEDAYRRDRHTQYT